MVGVALSILIVLNLRNGLGLANIDQNTQTGVDRRAADPLGAGPEPRRPGRRLMARGEAVSGLRPDGEGGDDAETGAGAAIQRNIDSRRREVMRRDDSGIAWVLAAGDRRAGRSPSQRLRRGRRRGSASADDGGGRRHARCRRERAGEVRAGEGLQVRLHPEADRHRGVRPGERRRQGGGEELQVDPARVPRPVVAGQLRVRARSTP